ncbi:MAG: hypothetical protein QF570_20555 [Myxococcota bacterium]|jgi:hypothetical protein|nr:hypothetical protein [Myxococcota bacterium]
MSNNEAVSGGRLHWSDLVAPLILVGIAFVWVYGVGGASTRIMQSYHGFHHAAYVTQVANGIVPPTNPSSAGAPANFYWGWHAALASGMWLMDVTPFELSLSSNALGLAMFLCGFWLCSGAFTRNPWLRLAACGLPLFILNPLGLVQFAVRLVAVWVPAWFGLGPGEGVDELVELARHHSWLGLANHDLAHLRPRIGLFGDVVLLDRAGHLLAKFLNFNSFPFAVGVYALAQDVYVNQRGSAGSRALAMLLACFVMAIASPLVVVGFGFTVVACALVEGPAEWRALRKTGFAGRRNGLWQFAAPAGGCALGVLLALPMLLPIAQAYGGETRWMLGAPGFVRHAIALGWALVSGVLLLVGSAALARHLDGPARVHAITLGLLATVALLVAAPVHDPNEYKFVLLSAFPASLLVLGLIAAWARRSQSLDTALRRPGWFAGTFAICGALSAASLALLYLASPWAQENPIRLHESTTSWAPTADARLRDFDAALTWLREEAPIDAFVFATARDKNDDPVPVIAQRRVVAQKASPFTRALASHATLVERNDALVERVARCEGAPAVRDAVEAVRTMDLPFESAPYALVEPAVGRGECQLEGLLRPKFRNDHYEIFELPTLALSR